MSRPQKLKKVESLKPVAATAVLVSLAFFPVAAAQVFSWSLPVGVAPPPVPADNPMTDVKVDLGRKLFADTRLSRDQSMSCGSCHWQHAAFAENRATHPGIDGSAGKRNPPPLANVGYASPLTWANPLVTTLERQALDPVFGEHPVEMGMAGLEKVLVERVSSDSCYNAMFAEAFPEERSPVSLTTIFKAIAAFERTLLAFNSPYDRAMRGEKVATTSQAKRGEELFEQKGCQSCHSGRNFSDYGYYDIGLPPSDRDEGLGERTGRPQENNLFRTPTLRNVWATGPFMHDGSITTVTGSILAHTKNADGRAAPVISEEEAADISMFLETLTDGSFLSSAAQPAAGKRCSPR
jgi:cytochrome c peroxidase